MRRQLVDLDNGKIYQEREYYDAAAMLTQLGVLTTAGQA
jgi:hypothetical protein